MICLPVVNWNDDEKAWKLRNPLWVRCSDIRNVQLFGFNQTQKRVGADRDPVLKVYLSGYPEGVSRDGSKDGLSFVLVSKGMDEFLAELG